MDSMMSGNDAALGEGFGRQIETLQAISAKEKSKLAQLRASRENCYRQLEINNETTRSVEDVIRSKKSSIVEVRLASQVMMAPIDAIKSKSNYLSEKKATFDEAKKQVVSEMKSDLDGMAKLQSSVIQETTSLAATFLLESDKDRFQKECEDISAKLSALEAPTSELDEDELNREAEKIQQEIEQTKYTMSSLTKLIVKLSDEVETSKLTLNRMESELC
jgi:chromosome segregation ATPase